MRRGWLFLNNRYHDPTLGTFISVDPLVTTTGEPYIYASGNPTTLSDPTGLCSSFVKDKNGNWTCTFYTADDGPRSVDNHGGDFCNRGRNICSTDERELPVDYEFGPEKPDKYDGVPTTLLVYQPPREPLDRALEALFPECDILCLAATGATAAVFGGLTAVACPTGTISTAGVGAAAACGGMAMLTAGATTGVYEKMSGDNEVNGDAILCSMGASAVVPPGTDLNVLVRPAATKVVGGLAC